MREIAISDIHGCARTFKKLVEDKVKLTVSDRLFLLGDYIDRGPDSKGVIDYIFELKEQGFSLTCLRGNHEQMLLDALEDSANENHWLQNGGYQTALNFLMAGHRTIPDRYLKFFHETELYIEHPEYLFVHAGFNFKVDDPLIDYYSMLWIRDWYPDIDKEWLGEKIIIHGHTPTKRPEIQQSLEKLDACFAINIDNGCYMFPHPFVGQLCALDLTNKALYFQKNSEERR